MTLSIIKKNIRLLSIIFLSINILLHVYAIPILLPNDVENNITYHLVMLEESNKDSVQTGYSGMGEINIRSLWTYKKKELPADFASSDVFARLSTAEWIKINHSRWSLGMGQGEYEAYDGNHDAGQLWLDLHSKPVANHILSPEFSMAKVDMIWFGTGYSIPFEYKKLHCKWQINARYLQINHFERGKTLGNVDGKDFTGLMKIVSASGTGCGSGWTTGTSLVINSGKRWQALIDINDLFGEITIPSAKVTDLYLVSPRIFEDPDGFIHDFWGATGSTWTEKHNTKIDRTLNLSLMRKGKQTIALIMKSDKNQTAFSILYAMPISNDWQVIVGITPANKQLLTGVMHSYGSIYLKCDDFPGNKPTRLSIYTQMKLLSF
jgi:hypothetical protein